jgi:hypothetical protein
MKTKSLIELIAKAQSCSINTILADRALELGVISKTSELAMSLGEQAFVQTLLLRIQSAPAEARARYVEFLNTEIADGQRRAESIKRAKAGSSIEVEAASYVVAALRKESDPVRLAALQQLVRYIAPGRKINQQLLYNFLEDYLSSAQASEKTPLVTLALEFSAAINAAGS